MPTKRKKKFEKMSKMMEGFCFITAVIGFNRANTGKDKDVNEHCYIIQQEYLNPVP